MNKKKKVCNHEKMIDCVNDVEDCENITRG